jgi:hypothetical protein
VTTTELDYAAEIARLNALAEEALAQYSEEAQGRRFADHTRLMLELLDEWITRAQEIDALRAGRGRGQAPGRSELVQEIEQRLTLLRTLMQ